MPQFQELEDIFAIVMVPIFMFIVSPLITFPQDVHSVSKHCPELVLRDQRKLELDYMSIGLPSNSSLFHDDNPSSNLSAREQCCLTLGCERFEGGGSFSVTRKTWLDVPDVRYLFNRSACLRHWT